MAPDVLPPAQPVYVLRGHTCAIHALHFMKNNARLLTGDSDGWVVSWSMAYKRPVAVWRAHQDGVLGIGSGGGDRIITHGRDNKLKIWELTDGEEEFMDKSLPIDDATTERRQPWLLHMLTVNALNFCSFTLCLDEAVEPLTEVVPIQSKPAYPPILIAVPNTVDSNGIDIFQLPSEKRISSIEAEKSVKTGMVMALAMHSQNSHLQIAAGFESGHLIIYRQRDRNSPWQNIYYHQSHSQPILSLSISAPDQSVLTSSADALLVRHPFPLPDPAIPFSSNSPPHAANTPLKTLQTKHSGQQSLKIRSDGKIFATAGWDGRVRVYGARKAREVAVLKWHREGVYAVDFGEVFGMPEGSTEGRSRDEEVGERGKSTALTTVGIGTELGIISTVGQERLRKVRDTHWVAVGGKDGKVSLWDVF